MPFFRSAGLAADNKETGGGFDPVTEADRAAERAIREILAAERPDDGILGEEEAARASRSGLTWVIDPIDGTRAFLAGLPTWGVLIGLDDGTGLRLGAIAQPFTGEIFVGVTGPEASRAWMCHRGEERPLACRPCPGLAGATLAATAPEMFFAPEWEAYLTVRRSVRFARYGTDCYAYAMLAMGQIDLVIEAGLNPYDIQAPIGVIEAAGGVVTDWDGGPAHRGGRALAAANPALHAAALERLRGV